MIQSSLPYGQMGYLLLKIGVENPSEFITQLVAEVGSREISDQTFLFACIEFLANRVKKLEKQIDLTRKPDSVTYCECEVDGRGIGKHTCGLGPKDNPWKHHK